MKKILIFVLLLTSLIGNAKNTSKFSQVINPTIPAEITFAGQTISFDRTDMYERLDREITSLTYAHGSTLLVLKRANRIFPILAPIFTTAPIRIMQFSCNVT